MDDVALGIEVEDLGEKGTTLAFFAVEIGDRGRFKVVDPADAGLAAPDEDRKLVAAVPDGIIERGSPATISLT